MDACKRTSGKLPPAKDSSVASGQRVLLIDGQSETEQVLRAVLEPQGHCVERIRSTGNSTASNNLPSPNVLVIHSGEFTAETTFANWRGVPRVVIESEREISSTSSATSSVERRLPKPFQYSDLIQAVEKLMSR